MLNEEVFPELGPPRSPLKEAHPVVGYLKGIFRNFVVLFSLGGGLFILHRYQILTEVWAWVGYIVCAGLYLLGLALATACLPFVWRAHARKVKWVSSLMTEMLHCYQDMKSDGPVSARHLLERLKVATDNGAVWPAPLYALLDDVMARTGRL